MEKEYGVVEATSSGQNTSQQDVDKSIIIIPGLMGSRLFTSNHVFDDTTRIWDPVIRKYDWYNDMSYSKFFNRIRELDEQLKGEEIYPRKTENQNVEISELKFGREYGAQNIYQLLVDGLCEEFPERKIYFFSYDWRKSNTQSAMELYKTMYRLKIKKADLVCHSMGGLVASKFYMMYRHTNRVDKIVTVATPYEGAPKLLNSMMNMDVLGEGALVGDSVEGTLYNLADILLGVHGGLSKDVKASLQGVAELLPTKRYVSQIPMQEVTYLQSYNNEKSGRDLSYDEYTKKCESIFNNKEEQGFAYSEIKEFQDSILTEDGHNALLEYENAYFCVGINYKTITSVRFSVNSTEIDKRLYESDLNYEQLGDGTVPFLSASMMNKMSGIAGVTKRCWFFIADHIGIVKDKTTKEWIADILKNGSSKKSSATITVNSGR